jgi:hypothetical protein
MKTQRVESIILIGIFYLIVFSSAIIWGLSYNSWQLREQLKWVSPLALEINFYLLLVAIIINIKLFKAVVSRITRRTWILALLIALSGTLMAMFVAPRTHRIFYDEDIYLNIGQNIANLKKAGMCNEGKNFYGDYQCSQLEYNKEPNGWPYLLSLLFRITRPSHLAGFVTNNFSWGLSALVVFFTGFFLFRSETAGLFGALLFALIPEGLRWSNTAAVEPSAAFFTGLALLAVILFVQNPGMRTLFLAAVFLPFAFQFRPESGMIVLPAGLLIMFMAPRELTKARFYGGLLLLIALSVPHFIHLYAVRQEGWGASGAVSKFALQYVEANFRANFWFYVKDRRFPPLFTLLFLGGIGIPMLKTRDHEKDVTTHGAGAATCSFFLKEKLVVGLWFLLFWGIFLFFYAGSYNYGADVRFSLVSYIPLSVLGGFGAAALSKWCMDKFNIEWIHSGLTLLILICFLSFLPYIRAVTQEAWDARADHKYAEIMANYLPPHSLVLTHNPNMFLIWGKNAAQASMATYNLDQLKNLFQQYPDGIYFHYNYWCTIQDELQRSFCENILEKFKSTEILSFQEQNKSFRLYRIELK